MAERELDSMAVRMLGDASSYLQATNAAQEATRATGQAFQGLSDRLKGLSDSMQDYSRAAAGAMASLGIKGQLSQALGAFEGLESAQLRLGSAIKISGQDVGETTADYMGFVDAMKSMTVVGGEAAVTMLQQATSMGLQGDAAKRAVQNAIALSAAMGKPAQAMIRLTAELELGTTTGLGRYLRVLRSIPDPTERARKAQEMLGGMFETARAQAGSAAGQIQQLTNIYRDLQAQLGEILAEAVAPLVGVAKEVIAWFAGLSKEVKTTLVTMAAFTAGFLLVGAAVTFLGPLLLAMFNPVVVVLGLVAAGVGAWVASMGGLRPALEYIKSQGLAAWAWLKPVRQAVVSLYDAVVRLAGPVWDDLRQGAIDAFGELFGEVDWDEWRDGARDAFLAIEFGLENAQQVMEAFDTYTRYSLLRLYNQWVYLWTEGVPAALDWFTDNWVDILRLVFNLWVGVNAAISQTFYTTMKTVVTNMVSTMSNLPKLLAKKMTLGDIWGDMGTQMKPVVKAWSGVVDQFQKDRKRLSPFEPPEREVTQDENDLRKEWEEQARILGESWDDFRTRKLAEFAADTGEAKKAGEEQGTTMGQEFQGAFGKQAQKLDAVLSGSAAALSRVAAFRDLISGMKAASTGPDPDAARVPLLGGGGAPAPAPKEAVDHTNVLLEHILGELTEMNEEGEDEINLPVIEIKPANLIA